MRDWVVAFILARAGPFEAQGEQTPPCSPTWWNWSSGQLTSTDSIY